MKNASLSKVKIFAKDSAWSIAALCMMNALLQFLLYPILERTLGAEVYGHALYLMGVITIAAVAIGSSANYAYLVSGGDRVPKKESLIWMLGASALLLPVSFGVLYVSGMFESVGRAFLFWGLVTATAWRYFGDVEYRLNTNYKGYFLYYLFVSLGYAAGIGLFYATGLWELILLPGECLGIVFVACNGRVLRWDGALDAFRFRSFAVSTGSLTLSNLLSSVVLNGDRLILENSLGGEAVTLYYVSSLLGKTMSLITTPLNSVIIGHLVKSKAQMGRRRFLQISLLGLPVITVVTAGTVVASYIFVSIVYPNEFEAASSLFILANLAQVFYFSSNILTVILIRYLKSVYQVLINGAYVAVFFAVCIAATVWFGLPGFAVGLLITNVFRYLFVTLIGCVKLGRGQEEATAHED